MKSQKIKILLAISVAVFILYLLTKQIQSQRLISVESPNRIVMNTIAKIIAVAPDGKIAQSNIDAAFEEIYRLEKLMNRFDPNSQISAINKFASEKPVQVHKDLFDILYQAIRLSEMTDGAFDITVGPLVDMWRKCAEVNEMPTDRQLADIKKIIGYDKLLLDSNDYSVRFAVEGMRLDLGGIAKGFAADRAQEIMKKSGAAGGLIDLGGQIGCFGITSQRGKWIVGIRNPDKQENNQIILKLSLADMAAATSGNYERFYRIGEHRFSHIFNPQTEESAEQISSDTIICPSGTQADALATALSVMGAAKGLELIEKTENTEAIIIPAKNKNELIKSSGADKFILK